MMSLESIEMEDFMVTIVRLMVLHWSYRASGCLFSIFGLKNTETKKIGLENMYLFLVTDRSDRYLAWSPVHLNLISYINMPIISNKIQ